EPKLDLSLFIEAEVLEEAHVPGEIAGSPEGAFARVAGAPVLRPREGGGVEIPDAGSFRRSTARGPERRTAHEVCTVAADAGLSNIAARENRQRSAGLRLENPGELPPAKHRPHQRRRSGKARQREEVRSDDPMGMVELRRSGFERSAVGVAGRERRQSA